jgi:hypothetical protein
MPTISIVFSYRRDFLLPARSARSVRTVVLRRLTGRRLEVRLLVFLLNRLTEDIYYLA